jgi:hypothetical protein
VGHAELLCPATNLMQLFQIDVAAIIAAVFTECRTYVAYSL